MKLSDVAVSLLNDAKACLLLLNENAYRRPIKLLSDATIGQHSRHFIEFYQCLFEQIQLPGQTINYDLRKRNRKIEETPAYAAAALDRIIGQLQAFCPEEPLKLSAEYPGDHSFTVDSSYERELMYNIEHTIHHLAILKIGFKIIAPDLQLPAGFGVACSTVKYQNSCVQ